jgi:primase-polymerase (primpol)-like protein
MAEHPSNCKKQNTDPAQVADKPAALPVQAEHIPQALRERRRWVVWRWTWTGKKWDKPPSNPRTGGNASSTNSKTWSTYAEAVAACEGGQYDGPGVVLGAVAETGPTLAGVDLDDVRDPSTGKLAPWARLVIDRLSTYSEVSPSQKGGQAAVLGTTLARTAR